MVPFKARINLVNQHPRPDTRRNRHNLTKHVRIQKLSSRIVRVGQKNHTCARRYQFLQRIQ